jgi:hypothetical protein
MAAQGNSRSNDLGKDHLSSQESFRFALHVATLAVLIVAFVTMVTAIGKDQNQTTKAVVPRIQEPVVEEMVVDQMMGEEMLVEEDEMDYFDDTGEGEDVLGMDTNDEENYFGEMTDPGVAEEVSYDEEAYFDDFESQSTPVEDELNYFGE